MVRPLEVWSAHQTAATKVFLMAEQMVHLSTAKTEFRWVVPKGKRTEEQSA